MLSPNNHSALTTLRFHLIEPPSQEFETYRQLLQDEQIYVTLGYMRRFGLGCLAAAPTHEPDFAPKFFGRPLSKVAAVTRQKRTSA